MLNTPVFLVETVWQKYKQLTCQKSRIKTTKNGTQHHSYLLFGPMFLENAFLVTAGGGKKKKE